MFCRMRNFPVDLHFGFVDLKHMSRVHRLFNYNQSTVAYIERVVPELSEEEQGTYPVPTTKDDVKLPNEGLSGKSAGMMVAGAVGWAALWVL